MVEVPGRVTMQLFVRRYCTMIAAPIQGDVDGIPKGSHDVIVTPMEWSGNVDPLVKETFFRKHPFLELAI